MTMPNPSGNRRAAQLIAHSKDELTQSTAPKRTANQAAPANPGMHHVAIPATHDAPGLLARGVSKTEATRRLGLDAVGEVSNTPTPIKRSTLPGNVPDHPQHRPAKYDPQPSLPDNRHPVEGT